MIKTSYHNLNDAETALAYMKRQNTFKNQSMCIEPPAPQAGQMFYLSFNGMDINQIYDNEGAFEQFRRIDLAHRENDILKLFSLLKVPSTPILDAILVLQRKDGRSILQTVACFLESAKFQALLSKVSARAIDHALALTNKHNNFTLAVAAHCRVYGIPNSD